MEKKKFKISTLGCRTNQYESQAYHDQLAQMGYEQAKDGESADLCIVNTCTVTESADSRSRNAIRRLIRHNPGAEVVVTGCLTEGKPKELLEIEGISKIVPNAKKESLIETLFPDVENLPEFSIQQFDAHTRAFVKVQDGCNSFCTYCIIPYVRGRSRSRKMEEILSEVRQLVDNGYKEIVLTGINIGDFDGQPEEGQEPDRLSDLVRAVDQIEGVERIRISSIDPDEVDDDLLDAVINSKKTCHSMHIVLQSGSNHILKRMNRKYTRQMFFDAVHRLKAACPDFTFTTDIIVGFPGESEEDFKDTIDAVERVQFAKVHMFPYSERPRTRAALYKDKVCPEDITRRKQELLRVAEKASYDLREQYVGREMTILTEKGGAIGSVEGHTDNFLMVKVPDVSLPANKLIKVKLVENSADGLIGKLID